MRRISSVKSKKNLLAVTFLIITVNAFSQKPLSPQSIPELLQAVDQVVKRQHIAGLMLGLATKDSVIFSGGFGYSDVDARRAVTCQTRFRMGSVTKMFVSMAVMKLVEEGRLELNAIVKSVAPEVPFQNPWEETHPLRIVHLLEHTSGFDDVMLNNMYTFDTTTVSGFSMTTLHRHSLVCRWKPGERSAYSNPNYVVLGYVIEKITHKKYEDYIREIILQQTGMTRSTLNNGSTCQQDETKEYIVRNDHPVEVRHVTLLTGPQGALWSSADDMTKFIQVFLNDGRPILSPQGINTIETSHSSLASRNGLTTEYALGNRNCFIHQKTPFRGHDGLAGTCYSGCYYNRELGVGFVIASNSNKPNYEIENLVVSFFERSLPGKKLSRENLDEKSMVPFEGWYQFDSPRNEISGFIDRLQNLQKVYIVDGTLYAKPLFQDPVELQQTGNLTFAYAGTCIPMVLFTRNENGNPVMCAAGGYFRKVSAVSARGERIVVAVVAAILASSFIAALISVIRTIRRKQNLPALIMQCLPCIGLIFFFMAVKELLYVKEQSYQLASLHTVTGMSITVFIGTTMFGLCSLLYATYILYRRICLKVRPGYYNSLLAMVVVLATLFLWHHGWIGLRTWAL